MKSSLLVSVVPFLVTLVHAGFYDHATLKTYDSGNRGPYDGVDIHVADGSFWLGRGPSVYCPDGVACPDRQRTALSSTGRYFRDLYVGAQGGQKIYVDSNGAMKYTPVLKPEVPRRSDTSGFWVGEGFFIKENGLSAEYLACPDAKQPKYVQLYADVKQTNPPIPKSECTRVFIEALEYTKAEAPVYGYN